MKFSSSILIAITFFSGLISCESSTSGSQESLPILGRKEVVEKVLNGETIQDTIYHTIGDFRFVDQDSSWVTPESFEGKIYVADFFFTSCPTICPIMKTQMLRVFEEFKDNPEVMILSHTIDPEYDTVALLKDFSERIGVMDNKKWKFVTGDKDEIYKIGQTKYMVSATEDVSEPGGFVHSGAFLLVDKDQRIRGIYDGTKEDQVDRLIKDIPRLLKEYETEL
ncbi:SCO family protein [Peijinzhouia sedimentorum]